MIMSGMKIVFYILIFGCLLFGLSVAIWASPFFGTIIAVLFIGSLLFFIKPILDSQKLLKTGVEAKGTILSTWDTGVTVNENPQIGLKLKIEPTGKPAYEVETKQLISRLQTYLYAPGTPVTVKYDPENPRKVVISGFSDVQNDTTPGMEPVNTSGLQRTLLEGEALRTKLMVSGIETQSKITEYKYLGVNVNGNNLASEITVEFETSSSGKYTTKITIVVSPYSIPKYQKDCIIPIRYDALDPSKAIVNL